MIRAGIERRRHPRLEQKLPFKVAANGYGFSTTTQNLSCLGAYCRIKKYIPPFTKVAVKLTLPIKTPRDKKSYTVDCTGVIVRTEDKDKRGFNIAIFFNEINSAQRKKISEYIDQFLPQGAASPAGSLNPRWGR
ncbi:MAG: PilZ domain-containing protein [Candidatus Omnitrophica bacterium]|nr:PilZ domain-containing protein [Candidatus Omnitrophota bacterium]